MDVSFEVKLCPRYLFLCAFDVPVCTLTQMQMKCFQDYLQFLTQLRCSDTELGQKQISQQLHILGRVIQKYLKETFSFYLSAAQNSNLHLMKKKKKIHIHWNKALKECQTLKKLI